MDGPLDFESEDQLLSIPRSTTKRRKVIGLDDLLTDYYTERSKFHEREPKKSKSKCYNSDEDDKARKKKENLLSKFVNDCEKQVHEIITEDEIALWGQRVFGHQKPLPSLNFLMLGNCELLQSFAKNELNSFFDMNVEKGEGFLEGLLINGWLSKFVFACGFVEDSVASWTFYQMLYSSNEELQVSACDFWCSILLSKNEVDQLLVRLGWFPSYSDLRDALDIYGYLPDSFSNYSSLSKAVDTDSGCEGPPQNIRSWIKVLSVFCRSRSIRPIFSHFEAEEFLCVIIRLLLDRQLQGLSFILYKCMQSVISFFMENEWNISSKNVAVSIADRIPKDLNCLRVVECISGISTRSKHLRSQLSFQILTNCFDTKVADGKEILELLMSINVKEKNCDFLKLYIYLSLAENWLLSEATIEDRPLILEMWCKYLRNCSSQITSTDWRSYASKVRNKASFLLQNSNQSCE